MTTFLNNGGHLAGTPPTKHEAEDEADLLLKYTELVSKDTETGTSKVAWMGDAKGTGKTNKLLISAFIMFILVSTVGIYFLLPQATKSVPTLHIFSDCGSNPDEARAKGCQFDPMAFIWTPKQCYHEDLIDTYFNMNGVEYYTNSTCRPEYRVRKEDVAKGMFELLYTPTKFHAIHCALVMTKLHYMLGNGLPIDDRTLNYGHTQHCQLELLGENPMCSGSTKCTFTIASAKYAACGHFY